MMRNAARNTATAAPDRIDILAKRRMDVVRMSPKSPKRLFAGVLAMSFLGALAGGVFVVTAACLLARPRADAPRATANPAQPNSGSRVPAPALQADSTDSMDAGPKDFLPGGNAAEPLGSQPSFAQRSPARIAVVDAMGIGDPKGSSPNSLRNGEYVVDGLVVCESKDKEKSFTLAF